MTRHFNYPWVIIKVSGHQCQWLAGGHDLEIGQTLAVPEVTVYSITTLTIGLLAALSIHILECVIP